MRQLVDALRLLLQDTAQIARETGEMLLAAQGNTQDPQSRTTLVKLGKEFQAILRDFQQLTEQAARRAADGDAQANSAPSSPSSAPEAPRAGTCWGCK